MRSFPMRSLIAISENHKACRLGGLLPSLDFAGLSALVGSNATKAGIPYTCLVHSRVPYINAYLTAGTLGLAQAVLSCIAWRPARILTGAGEAGSMLEFCGAMAGNDADYVGLQSATTHPVRGVVGEAVVQELLNQGKKFVSRNGDCSIGRSADRPTYVVWARICSPDNIGSEPVRVPGEYGALVNYVALMVCVGVLILNAICHEWLAFWIVAIGMFLNATMAALLRTMTFEYPKATPAKVLPPGDCVVRLKSDPDAFCVLWGSEVAIQKLLQKEVVLNPGWVECFPLFLVSVAFMLHSTLVVLGVPHMGATAQFLFLIAVFVGAATDLIKGSWNGKRGLAKEAMEKFGIKRVDVKKFGNRTAAVACVAKGTKNLDSLKTAGLCPTSNIVWRSWWTALGIHGDASMGESEIAKRIQALSDAIEVPDEKRVWLMLYKDMQDGRDQALDNVV